MKRLIFLRSPMAATAALAMSLGMFTFTGCETERSSRVTRYQEPDLSLHASTRRIYIGEVVTVTTETSNLLGRDAEVRWNTTGGELTTQESGRLARVKFDAPGTYVVSAQLWADGELVHTDSVKVDVLSLK